MTSQGAAESVRRIGVYGGTFNPIHRGHLRAAAEVAAALDLERVVFVPSAEPPHKTEEMGTAIASARERLHWVECALEPHPNFEVDPIEVERGGTSYTVDTLSALCERFAGRRLVFIIGHDAFLELGTWREPQKLLSMVDWAVMTRPPLREGGLAEWLPDCAREVIEIDREGLTGRHHSADTRIQFVAIDALEISSSRIREGLRKGVSVDHWLPEEVHASIVSSACYCSGDRESDPIAEPDKTGTS